MFLNTEQIMKNPGVIIDGIGSEFIQDEHSSQIQMTKLTAGRSSDRTVSRVSDGNSRLVPRSRSTPSSPEVCIFPPNVTGIANGLF